MERQGANKPCFVEAQHVGTRHIGGLERSDVHTRGCCVPVSHGARVQASVAACALRICRVYTHIDPE